jgi:hypothetical protein
VSNQKRGFATPWTEVYPTKLKRHHPFTIEEAIEQSY